MQVNIEIMRAFVRLRRILAADPELARRVAKLEKTTKAHDDSLHAVFAVIRSLVKGKPRPQLPPPSPPLKLGRPIGFRPNSPKPKP